MATKETTSPAHSAQPFLTEADLAKAWNISPSTLEKMRRKNDGSGPPYLRIGRSIRYCPVETAKWLDSRLAQGGAA